VPSVDPLRLQRQVGRRVADLRRTKAWTQDQFAERLGVSLKYVQRVEAGTENLTLGSLARLAGQLGVEVPALFVAAAKTRVVRGRPKKTAASFSPRRGRTS
jgi:transcriptional regulator with XRE-family HTH domain